jgi:hypothetical protein
MSTMTAVPPVRTVAKGSAARHLRAWAHVAEGCRRAISELSPGDAQLERLRRCLRQAQALAGGENVLTAMPGGGKRREELGVQRSVEITAAERAAVIEVAEAMFAAAEKLPLGSRVRAWVLRVRHPLVEYVGARSYEVAARGGDA